MFIVRLEATAPCFSFFNRIVDMWNSLPFHVRSASIVPQALSVV